MKSKTLLRISKQIQHTKVQFPYTGNVVDKINSIVVKYDELLFEELKDYDMVIIELSSLIYHRMISRFVNSNNDFVPYDYAMANLLLREKLNMNKYGNEDIEHIIISVNEVIRESVINASQEIKKSIPGFIANSNQDNTH